MARYFAKRVLMVVPILLGVILVLFALLYNLPGSRLTAMRISGDGDALDSAYAFLNVSESFFSRYLRYCFNLFIKLNIGGFGYNTQLLSLEMSYRVHNTILLLISSICAAFLFGVPIGVYTAVHKDKLGCQIISTLSLVLSALPQYTIAMVLALVLCIQLRILPLVPSFRKPIAFLLPTITMSLCSISSIERMTRTSINEVLKQPYIYALRLKGLKSNRVVWIHALKNALVPVVSTLGGLIAQLLCGTIVVEYFFNIPGLGTLMLNAVPTRDHFAVLVGAVSMTLILCITNIASDIIFSFINPHIRLRFAKTKKKPE